MNSDSSHLPVSGGQQVQAQPLLSAVGEWKSVDRDGFPPCDGHTVFIGINSAGYACCFNAIRGGLCVTETPEGNYRQMSDMRDWRLLDRPQHHATDCAQDVDDEWAITPEMMTEAAKAVGFDPVPGRLTRLAGALNALLGAAKPVAWALDDGEQIRVTAVDPQTGEGAYDGYKITPLYAKRVAA